MKGAGLDRKAFKRELLRHASAVNLPLTAAQMHALEVHAELMLQWNLRTNLTRILQIEDIVTQHILDSLLPARWLPHAGKALDVGTGAGFPGIPLKIIHPHQDMTLLESNRKKVSFLKVLCSRLALKGLRVVHSSWEEWAMEGSKGGLSYDLIAMRAVRMEVSHLVHLASPLLAPEGCFALWAGPESALPAQGLAEGSPATKLTFQGSHPYLLPGTSGERRILIWTRKPW